MSKIDHNRPYLRWKDNLARELARGGGVDGDHVVIPLYERDRITSEHLDAVKKFNYGFATPASNLMSEFLVARKKVVNFRILATQMGFERAAFDLSNGHLAETNSLINSAAGLLDYMMFSGDGQMEGQWAWLVECRQGMSEYEKSGWNQFLVALIKFGLALAFVRHSGGDLEQQRRIWKLLISEEGDAFP